MLTPDLSNDAVRFLKKLDKKQFGQLFSAITALCGMPSPTDLISVGNGTHFRNDVGEYRVIYCFDEKVLFVSMVGNRNDSAAYQEFDREK
jgi:mRNA-degrading endonuclease RelE of RelBE toxin-antitoxin system